MRLISKKGSVLLVIEEDLSDIGAYLYVYNQKKECTADYLQDNVVSCKKQAYELYGVPYTDWYPYESDFL